MVGEGAAVGEGARVGARAMVGVGAVVGARQARFASRSDGYVFTVAQKDGVDRVYAGCRDFTKKEALAHWNRKHKHYAETRAILAFLFR